MRLFFVFTALFKIGCVKEEPEPPKLLKYKHSEACVYIFHGIFYLVISSFGVCQHLIDCRLVDDLNLT